MSSDLKRCPFCGGEAKAYSILCDGLKHIVSCQGCLVETPLHDTREDLTATWNRRADGWIAVEDGLPEMRTDVWVHYRDGGIEIGCCRLFHGRPRWFVGFTIFPEGTVTHWMPLPEPPEIKDVDEKKGGTDK